MKKRIDLLLAIFLVVVSFGFISCESDQEEIEAKYTYVGEIVSYYDFPVPPIESITCLVNDNSLLLKKKKSRLTGTAHGDKPSVTRLDVVVSNDTIYLYEKWFNTWTCNCEYVIDENILVTNIPKGRWIVNNIVCFYPNETEDDLTFYITPEINVDIPEIVSKNIFSIEIK